MINTTQQQLLYLIRQVIHDEVPSPSSFLSINGQALYDLALRQNVWALIYPTLEKYSQVLQIDEEIMHKWRTATLFVATHQIRRIDGLKTAFELLKANDILAISVKGLALRQVYPLPELRNMGDVDLLIHEQDMQKSIELLKKIGYQANLINLNDPDYMHIDMHRTGSFPIELHRTLWHPKHMKNIDTRDWFKHIWENHRHLNVEGIEFEALAPEDELINLVIHLARNLKNNNANLQQLCDMAIFLNKYHYILDFNYIEKTIKSMNLLRYYQYLQNTCDMFLGLKVTINFSNLDKNKSTRLMENILNSGYQLSRIEKEGWFVKIKIFLDGISFTRKLLKPLRTRARFLRSIGLHFKY